MTHRLRETGCRETTFVEAGADLRLLTLSGRNHFANPVSAGSPRTLASSIGLPFGSRRLPVIPADESRKTFNPHSTPPAQFNAFYR